MEPEALVAGNLVQVMDHPEWGIGTVEELDGEVAHVHFARGEGALRPCPRTALRRHRYAVNDQIYAITEQAYGIVLEWRESNGLITYQALFGRRRKGIPETNIRPDDLVQGPFDLLQDGTDPDARAFLLAIQARRLQYAYRYDELVCLSNARIELLPHQVFVTDRVLRDYPHRFLLSDEVGLGKTIEAGLILKELRARGAAKRVLIIVPAGLVSQWVDELRKKFNESFIRIDSTNIAAHIALSGGQLEQVWQSNTSIVTSLHMLRTNEAYITALAEQEWDLVIFDEAHHLRRHLERRRSGNAHDQDERRATAAYRLAERLQQRTTSLLLLTATPLQLHTYELYSLIELLDPALFANFADFERYRELVPRLNRVASRLEAFETLGTPEREALASDLTRLLREAEGARTPYAPELLAQLADPEQRASYQTRITDAHRLTRILIRNRKRLVFDDLQPRVARILRVEFSAPELAAYQAVTTYLQEWYNLALQNNNRALGFLMVTYRKILTSSSYALRQSFKRRIARLGQIRRGGRLLERQQDGMLDIDEVEELDEILERYGDVVIAADPGLIDIEIEQIQGLCAMIDQITIDTKAERLLAELARLLSDPKEKVLIFTQFKETLFYLKHLLEPRYAVAEFHGDMDAAEKDQAVDDFRGPKQIMLATEAAGEGRNLQFCHIMVNYDLPWNPMKIEQRIGRLDRIGQRDPVQIFNFAIQNTLEERILQVLHERINIFESIVGTLDPILESIEQDVRELMFGREGTPEEQLAAFEQRVAERAREVRQMEAKLDDFLLDRSSFRRDRADAILGQTPAFSGADIQHFLTHFLEHTGGQVRERAAGAYDLTIPRRMQATTNDLRDGYRATFDAAIAQQQERLDFIAFGHPVLDRAVELCLDDQFGGRTAHLMIPTNELPAQQAVVAIYEFVFEGIRPRRELRAFAASLAGAPAPDLAGQFFALLPRARVAQWDADERQRFDQTLHDCREVIATEVALALEHARQAQDGENRREYDNMHRKLTRFYDAQRLTLERDLQRLERLLAEQQRSDEPNIRRIVPATQGRVDAARRQRDDLEHEHRSQLANLSRSRTVVAAEELLSAAYVRIQKDPAHGS